MKVILAEKPSVARDLARVLNATTQKKGYFEGKGFAVTWTFGHLVELEAPEHYNPAWKRWSLHTLPMIPGAFALRPRGDDGAQAQLKVVRDLFHQADELICATDAGREGELIFRYVQSWAGCEEKPFRRLWIRSMTDRAIKEGFGSLRDGHRLDPLYQAARCRSEADWIVGLNATRFFTLKFRQQDELWSVGRVQTPVLAMIVNRDLEIEQFRPQDYWEVHTLYRGARFRHRAGRIDDRTQAEALLAKVTGQPFEIIEIKQHRRTIPPPALFDLTELQREMNKRYGMTANRTLKTAQDLYERKHITYPRTDSRYLSSDLKPRLGPLLESLRAIRADEVARIDLDRLNITRRIVDDDKVSDHHAIIPTEQVSADLTGDLQRVYEAIVTRFLAVFYPPCLKDQTVVKGAAHDELFTAGGTVVADPGWQALVPHLMKAPPPPTKGRKKKQDEEADAEAEENQVLPAFEQGEQGPHQPEIKQRRTKPPPPFNEASLLQMMETAGKQVDEDELREALKEKGLGTPATRAAIIETLLGRGFIRRRKKQLLSTETGRHLIRIVGDERLKSPELTGEWELQLKQIEQSAYDPERFMADVIEYTRQILRQTGIPDPPRRVLGPCPHCGADIIEGKRGFGCSRWKDGCRFVLWKDQFGARLDPLDAEQLLRRKQTTQPKHLEIDGEPVQATLHLQDDGTVNWRPAPAAPPAARTRNVLGPCPRCGSDVIEGEKGFGCSGWKAGCRFVVWKTLSHRRISKEMVRVLLKNGITPFIQKFKNRQGKRFDARLKLVDGEVRFDFTPNPPSDRPDENPAPE